MTRSSHYAVLSVPSDATMDVIRRAYRELAKRLHPDTNPSADASTKFAALAEAYEVLSDREKRRRYDHWLGMNPGTSPAAHASPQPPEPSTPVGGEGPTAHYSWVNVAGAPSAPASEVSDIQELYDTFFQPARSGKSQTTRAGRHE